MSNIIPIPTTRVSGLLMRQRLTQQFQTDQLALFKLQEQISTGRRIILPSEDAPAALRAISLQRLLARKDQFATNISTGKQFLAATDTALNQTATQLGDIRGIALGVAGTIATDNERASAVAEINRFLEQTVTTANRQFRGRYLFAGTQTSQKPYSFDGHHVTYHGDTGSIQSHSDFGVLFSSNANGQSVFGGTTAEILGSADLDPSLNRNTRLSGLRGGRGISPNGAIAISDGQNTSIVDLSGASTIGDVVRLIEENPPAGRQIQVSVTGSGLTLQLLDPNGIGGNLTITEVGNGSVARELGILEREGVQTNPLVGHDLNPVLLKTTQLDSLLGTKAFTEISFSGNKTNNGILLEASSNGSHLNGVSVQFVADGLLAAGPGLSAGNEVAEYDTDARAARAALTLTGTGNDLILTANLPGVDFNNVVINLVDGGAIGDAAAVAYDGSTKVLTIAVDSTGGTTVQTVIDEIANEGTFTAVHDNSVETTFDPAATINPGDIGVAQGNTGNSGGEAKTLFVRIRPGATNANHVVQAINSEGTFQGKLNPADSTSFAEAGSGLVNLSPEVKITSGGSGTNLDQASGLRITSAGQVHELTFENAKTVEDLLNVLNGAGIGLSAEINANKNGINIRSRVSGSDFQIGENGGQTATQLGVRTTTTSTKLSNFNYGVGIPTKSGFSLPTKPGEDFTISSSDGQEFSIDLSGAESVQDVVDAINAVTTTNITAQLGAPGNVIQLVDNTFPDVGELTVTQTTGSLAAQFLGLIPNGETQASTTTDTLSGSDDSYIDFRITAADGQSFGIDISKAKTLGDIIDVINSATGGAVIAQLPAFGNGIQLIDQTIGPGHLMVSSVEGSQAAEYLGFVPEGQGSASGNGSMTTVDRHYLENESVFNTLVRLRDAIQANDINAIERAIAKIDQDIDRVTFARADVGATLQGLDLSEISLQDETIQLKSALSNELDVDLVEAISELTARQISMQASLQATANILQLSLLDFI